MYIWVHVLGYDVESISYCRSWCKKMKSLPYRALDGLSLPCLPPHRHLIYVSFMSLGPGLADLHTDPQACLLTYTKGLPTCYSFCGDSPVPWLTPTISQTSHESTFPRETCWDLLTRSSSSSHALGIQSTLSSWFWFHIIHVIICLFLQSSTKARIWQVSLSVSFILVSFMCAFLLQT